MAGQSIVTLMVEREEETMTPWGGMPKTTKTHFLLPSLNPDDATPTVMIPPTDLAGLSSSSRNDLPLELSFDGWKHSTERWEQWVTQMRPRYQPLWERAGIADAIGSSVCTIVQHKDVILELSDRWCSETKSFLFPWGEATITLEDVAVIGGYSLGDECVLKPLETQAMKDIEYWLLLERLEIQRTKAARACQLLWMSKFMDNGSELEHEAFLCFWLSRFVFPGPAVDTIRKNVLPIAIHLSRGTKMALAPAVLASIYRDLHFLKRREQHTMRKTFHPNPLQKKITLWAPFQLVQVWIWERFPYLSPLNRRTIQISAPRLCVWKKAKTEVMGNLAQVFDRSGNTFLWRPYINTPYYQGFMSQLYGEKHIRVMDTYLHKDSLENFVRCIRISELVGVDDDCIEQYMPHRVGMQFGFSQDIPISQIAREDGTSIIAWRNYTRPITEAIIYVPPRYCQPQVSTRYYACWKRSLMIRLEGNSAIRIGGQSQRADMNRKRTLEGHLKCQETARTDEMMNQEALSLSLGPTAPADPPRAYTLYLASNPSYRSSRPLAPTPARAPVPPPPPASAPAHSQPGAALTLIRDPFPPPPGFPSRFIFAVKSGSDVIPLPFFPR